MLIRGAEVAGRAPLDVRLEGEHVAAIAAALERRRGEPVFDARYGALLPGLHDHHLHLHALAAAETSIRCGPPQVSSAAELAAALRAAAGAGRGWLRGVGYHESVAGALDRDRLDAWVPSRPLRVQHRSGSLWMLNSVALAELGVEQGGRVGAVRDPPLQSRPTRSPEGREAAAQHPTPESLERDASGCATGRLFRGDAWLRARLAEAPPDLAAVGASLASFGVTGLTDATAHNDAATLRRLSDATDSGALPQRLLVMGEPDLPEPDPSRGPPSLALGAVKALLDDARLPDFDAFCERIRSAHAQGRAFAVHCVTRAELVFAVEAFRRAGTRAGDRLEHAAVAPPELVRLVAGLPLGVVTQPHFIAERGDVYRQEVAPEDLPWLYRGRGWLDAGVPLAAGSDAPYGSPDPWRSLAAAVRRTSAAGATLGAEEALSPEQALALWSASASDPGGPSRRVAVGSVADLCLLDRPWRDARTRLCSADVAATWCAGRLVWQREPSRRTVPS